MTEKSIVMLPTTVTDPNLLPTVNTEPNAKQLKESLNLVERYCKSTDRFFDYTMWTRFLQKKEGCPSSSWTSILFEYDKAYAIGSFTIQKTFYTENLSVDVLYVIPEKRCQGVARSLLKLGCMWGVQQKGVFKAVFELPPRINPGVMSLLSEFNFAPDSVISLSNSEISIDMLRAMDG